MRRGLIFLLIFVFLLTAPTAVRYLQHYRLGGGDRTIPATGEVYAVVESVATPRAAAFVDEPEMFGGMVLLDQSHDNAFTLDEISYLDGRLAARGVEVVSYTGGDLATALRAANAFVVITPLQPFSTAEVRAVENFVRRGGNLLMLGDPTRYSVVVEEDLFTFNVFVETDKIPLNSLANSFDIIFNGDYLYNTRQNEGNFRNIVLNEESFTSSPLTADLESVVFYGSHSLQVGSRADVLLTGDDNTWSSATDRPGGLFLAATAVNNNVLAIGDIQFLMEPYYTVMDNARFITQIADFLASPIERDFSVADFPYFFAEDVDLVYTGGPQLGPNAFDEIITLQASLREAEKELSLTTVEAQSGDAIYLGLYNQAEDVADMLAGAGITLTIDPAILTGVETAALDEAEDGDPKETAVEEEVPAEEDTAETEEPAAEESFLRLIQSELGSVQMSGTALILLDEGANGRRLVVLAASHEGLENTINRLLDLIPLDADYALADCLLQDNLALCPTNVNNEEVEAELLTGGDLAKDEDEAADEEEEEDEGATDEEDDDEPEEPPGEEIDATDQGSIGLGDTVEGALPEGEAYSWTFSDGPAVIDITVESGDDLDAILQLFDADNNLITSADSGFTGDDETIVGADIPDEDEYTIVLKDFYDDGGEFVLTVTESDEAPADEEGDEEGDSGSEDVTIFLFIDDDGDPIGDGFTSQAELEALLADDYTVETWVTSEDGPLAADALETADLLIWDSGDYLNPDGFLDEDSFIVFEYIDSGRPLLLMGSSLTLFGDIGLTALSDLEFVGEDEVLLEGFEAGQVLTLDDTYEVVFADFLIEDLEPGSVAFLLQGPESEGAGNVVGLASTDEFNNDQQSVFLLMPFSVLPEDVQAQLLTNMLAWLGFSAP
ncbi:MAG: hypothetical protein IPM53_32760 [Anaerolineaceae bacterium]|nr:hypothetical protein [Anaerolineaceae bacterium]